MDSIDTIKAAAAIFFFITSNSFHLYYLDNFTLSDQFAGQTGISEALFGPRVLLYDLPKGQVGYVN